MSDFSPEPLAQGARADTGTRFVALLIDGVVLFVVDILLVVLTGAMAGRLLGFLLGLAYYVYLEGSTSGQTIGKRAMNIRVIDAATEGPLGPGKAAVRSLGRIVSSIPCGLGYFWALWDPQRQTWHDKIAATYVVPVSAYPVSEWPGSMPS